MNLNLHHYMDVTQFAIQSIAKSTNSLAFVKCKQYTFSEFFVFCIAAICLFHITEHFSAIHLQSSCCKNIANPSLNGKEGRLAPWLSGGDGGSRTRVQECFRKTFSERSRLLLFRAPLAKRQTRGFAIPWILLRYREITQEVPACMTPGSQTAVDLRPTRGAELCSQCERVVCFSVSF